MKKVILSAFIFLNLILAAGLFSRELPDRRSGAMPDDMMGLVDLDESHPIGSPAPEFTLQTPEGEKVSLSDLRGKWVVLEFGSRT